MSKTYCNDDWLTKKELAERLHITPRTIELHMKGGLPYLKLSRRCVRFKLEDVENFMRERAEAA